MAAVRRFDRTPPDEPRLLEGARLFDAGRYFESHEVWESLWHEVADPQREALQGLIQVAAAFHHLSQRNAVGAAYLLGRAAEHLRRPQLPAWLNADAMLADGERALAALRCGCSQPAPRKLQPP